MNALFIFICRREFQNPSEYMELNELEENHYLCPAILPMPATNSRVRRFSVNSQPVFSGICYNVDDRSTETNDRAGYDNNAASQKYRDIAWKILLHHHSALYTNRTDYYPDHYDVSQVRTFGDGSW
jgi:hypothetical protein